MILDKQNLFSDDQAITVTAASTNLIDMGALHARIQSNPEFNSKILAQVTADFATLTSLTVALQSDDNAAFASAATHGSEVVAVADLVAGKQVVLNVPREAQRYIRLYYTVTGSDATAGNVVAGVILDIQTADA